MKHPSACLQMEPPESYTLSQMFLGVWDRLGRKETDLSNSFPSLTCVIQICSFGLEEVEFIFPLFQSRRLSELWLVLLSRMLLK